MLFAVEFAELLALEFPRPLELNYYDDRRLHELIADVSTDYSNQHFQYDHGENSFMNSTELNFILLLFFHITNIRRHNFPTTWASDKRGTKL